MHPPVTAFALPDVPTKIQPFGRGHINETFRVWTDSGTFLLQRVNSRVFPDPEAVMANAERIIAHLRNRLIAEGVPDVDRRCLDLIPSRDGRSWVRDATGALWRCWSFLEGTRSLTRVEDPTQAETVAFAYGRFLRHLEDLPGPPLHTTIPHFQDGMHRLEAFHRALEADPWNRARDVRTEIATLLAHAEDVAYLQNLRERGERPLRPTHQDTKLDNVLIDRDTGEARCVVDLDTTMPGLALGDFGDLARSACAASTEDEANPHVDEHLFIALARGFDRGLGGGFLAREREELIPVTRCFAYMLAVRFLTDHLEGDRYFRIHHPGHNLERARAQLALGRALEAARGRLEQRLRHVGAPSEGS